MPTPTNLCHSCKKYKNGTHSNFSTYKNILNRRCKSCVVNDQMEKYENPREPEPYTILLRMKEDSPGFSYLLPFYQEMYGRGIVERAVPYIKITEQFRTRDIESVLDRIWQMKRADLGGELSIESGQDKAKINRGGEYQSITIDAYSLDLRKFLKQLNMSFPFIGVLYGSDLLLYKTEDSSSLARFEVPPVLKTRWEIVARGGNGEIVFRV